jgi:halimadienyl-diphosphate synthase
LTIPSTAEETTGATPHEELKELVSRLGEGSVAPVSYHTAWTARVGQADAPNAPAFPRAIEWLLHHQHGDGTWGGLVAHHQDRVLSTLAAMLALAQWREVDGAFDAYTDRLHAAAWGLAPHLAALGRDPCALVDFDRRLAASLAEARWRGLVLPVTGERIRARAASSAGGSEEDGAGSPAVTARYLLRHPGSRPARAHLEAVVARHAGAAAPDLEAEGLLEAAWVLHNVALTWPDHPGRAGTWSPAVAGLRTRFSARRPPPGGPALPADGASLALAFRVLCWAGEEPEPARLRGPRDDAGVAAERPYQPLARVGDHIHFLAALRAAQPFGGREAAIRQTIGFLARTATTDHYWVDGRHASPYHATGQAVIALGPGLSLTEEAVAWIERTQRPDGSWGFYDRSTVEESACCVQALACHRRAGGGVEAAVVEAGARWIEQNRPARPRDYEPLWVGEALFAPTWVVHATVLSALTLARAA